MATNKQLFSIQKYLSSSAVDKFKLERVFEVNKAKTPKLYNDIVNDVQFLENNGLFILIDGEDVQVRYANGVKVWSDAVVLSNGGGGSEPTEVDWADIQNKPTTFAPIIGTTANTAKAGDWTPTASDIPNLATSKITSGTFADARIPSLAISKISGLQTALDGKVSQADVIAYLQGLDGYVAGAVLTATADGFEWTTL